MLKKFITLSFLALLLASLISPTPAPVMASVQSALAAGDLTLVGQAGGVTTAVVYSGGKLFFNVGPRVAMMDASTLSAPVKPETYGAILPGIPEDIKAANGYLYVAMGYDGVAILSTSTLQIVAAQALPDNAYAYALAVGGHRLYIAAGDLGIVSYDLGLAKNTL
ncbi:hypothetical protein EHM76_07515, partial [bacterium]